MEVGLANTNDLCISDSKRAAEVEIPASEVEISALPMSDEYADQAEQSGSDFDLDESDNDSDFD
jgi:hypothetical protein